MLVDLLIILLLILLNGVFAMSELAIVSARKARLNVLAEGGNKGAAMALHLAAHPGEFLSSIQIGITLIGIFSGAYSGATLAEPLADYFATFPDIGTRADDLAIGLVVAGVTYLSLIIGELVPKQLALRHAESIACIISRPLKLLAHATTPIVFILDRSNRLVLRLLGVEAKKGSDVTEEEVRALIAESTLSGALEPEEQQLMERVMRLDDISVENTMTPRHDIVWFDVHDQLPAIVERVRSTRHSRYVVCEGSMENVLGIVVVKDLLLQQAERGSIDIRACLKTPLYLPETTSVLEAVEQFKKQVSNMALVLDEYGTVEGMVTLKDVMEAIVGVLPEPAHREDYTATKRADGSWLVDGMLPVHEAEDLIGIRGLADEDDSYATVAGLILHLLRQIPKAGDRTEYAGCALEVLDMDGHRIDKVLITIQEKG